MKFDSWSLSISNLETKFNRKFKFQIRHFQSNSKLHWVEFKICPSLAFTLMFTNWFYNIITRAKSYIKLYTFLLEFLTICTLYIFLVYFLIAYSKNITNNKDALASSQKEVSVWYVSKTGLNWKCENLEFEGKTLLGNNRCNRRMSKILDILNRSIGTGVSNSRTAS